MTSDDATQEARTEDRIARQIAEAATAQIRQRTREEARKRFDLDVRGLIAIIVVLAGFALGFAQLVLTGSSEIPAWAAGVVGSVVGYYFASRGVMTNGGQDGDQRR